MVKMIDFVDYPMRTVLPILLQDKSTKKHIIWATDPPVDAGEDVTDKSQITEEQLMKAPDSIQPRIQKELELQQERTRKKGEVFIPAWICNLMNNHCDEEWFGRKNIFNIQRGHTWSVIEAPIVFSCEKNGQIMLIPEGWKLLVVKRHILYLVMIPQLEIISNL